MLCRRGFRTRKGQKLAEDYECTLDHHEKTTRPFPEVELRHHWGRGIQEGRNWKRDPASKDNGIARARDAPRVRAQPGEATGVSEETGAAINIRQAFCVGVGDGFTILELYHIMEDLKEGKRNNKRYKISVALECKDLITGDKRYITSLPEVYNT